NIDSKGWASTDSAGPACDDCGAGAGGVRGTLQDNIAAWNRRANVAHATAPLQAEIEALRAEVDEWKRVAAEAAAALEAAREDAERWRHARRILTVEDIESSQDMFDAFGVEGDEHENRKADAAIDQARGKGVEDEA